MNNIPIKRGVALLCSREGLILDVIRDDVGLSATHGDLSTLRFEDLFEPSSRNKAAALFEHIFREGAVFNWELNVQLGEAIDSLFFAGGLAFHQVLLLGSKSSEEVLSFYNEFLNLTQDQIHALRSLLSSTPEPHWPKRQGAFIEELSRLNNELVNVHRELHKKNAELMRVNEQKNLFLGMAAHDLRNPLGVIRAYSDFLREDLEGKVAPEVMVVLKAMSSSSSFMLNLVDELLDLSQIESGKLELRRQPTDLPSLVKASVTLNQVLARGKNVELVMVAEEAEESSQMPPKIMLDPVKLAQVLNNLLTNAVKQSPRGATVWTRVWREGNNAHISISDQGPGVPSSLREAIFQPFFKASLHPDQAQGHDRGEMGQSAGLGLMIVRRIVEGHGGRIWVEDAPGAGAAFHVSLPFQDNTDPETETAAIIETKSDPVTEARPEVSSLPAPSAPRFDFAVLVVEDDPLIASITLRLLQKAGYSSRAAANGQEALELLRRHRFGLALMDLQMPVLDGRETLARIRAADSDALNPGMPVIALSGENLAPPGLSPAPGQPGFDGFLHKPVDFHELVTLMKKLGF